MNVLQRKWAEIPYLSVRYRKARSAGPAAQDDMAALAMDLCRVLMPVQPAPAFREELARDLAAVAHQKKSPRIVLQRPRSHRRDILIGAAVSSAVSVAGFLAYLWHQRASQSSHRLA